MNRQMRHQNIPKPELLKQVRAAWRAAGRPAPRGFVFPPVGVIKQRVQAGFATANELLLQMRERDTTP